MFRIRDASGTLVAIHERYDNPDGSKRYLWRQPDGTPGLGGILIADLPLYGIDRLDGLAATVVLVEGEKCAEALWRVGIAAVGTVTGASGTPSSRVLAELTGRSVPLWPDADPVGGQHMARIAELLAGVASRLTTVEPPEGVPAGWDAADAIAEGRDVAAILAAATPFEGQRSMEHGTEPDLQPRDRTVGGFLELTGAQLLEARSAVELPSLPFLGLDGYVVLGWSHLVSGYPRVGKTELLVDCVARWLSDGHRVLYVTEEPESMWSARLHAVSARWPVASWDNLSVAFGLGAGPAALLRRALDGTEPIVVVDAARNLLRISDENDNSAVARALNPWVAGAREAAKTVVVAHHDRKGGGQHGEGIAGGHAFLGIFDIALEVTHDPQAPDGNRRSVRAYARLVSPPPLLYERVEDGSFRALGDPGAVQLGAVEDRLLDILTEEGRSTADCHQALGDPRPSEEQVRLALTDLARAGTIRREPPIELGHARGRRLLWSLIEAPDPTSNGPDSRLELNLGSSSTEVVAPESHYPTGPWPSDDALGLESSDPLHAGDLA